MQQRSRLSTSSRGCPALVRSGAAGGASVWLPGLQTTQAINCRVDAQLLTPCYMPLPGFPPAPVAQAALVVGGPWFSAPHCVGCTAMHCFLPHGWCMGPSPVTWQWEVVGGCGQAVGYRCFNGEDGPGSVWTPDRSVADPGGCFDKGQCWDW